MTCRPLPLMGLSLEPSMHPVLLTCWARTHTPDYDEMKQSSQHLLGIAISCSSPKTLVLFSPSLSRMLLCSTFETRRTQELLRDDSPRPSSHPTSTIDSEAATSTWRATDCRKSPLANASGA